MASPVYFTQYTKRNLLVHPTPTAGSLTTILGGGGGGGITSHSHGAASRSFVWSTQNHAVRSSGSALNFDHQIHATVLLHCYVTRPTSFNEFRLFIR
jgi:hypothetical protein